MLSCNLARASKSFALLAQSQDLLRIPPHHLAGQVVEWNKVKDRTFLRYPCLDYPRYHLHRWAQDSSLDKEATFRSLHSVVKEDMEAMNVMCTWGLSRAVRFTVVYSFMSKHAMI